MSRYRVVNRDQLVMLPLHLDQFVEDDHLAKKIWNILAHMDLSYFDQDYKNSNSGALAYNPINMVAILFYAYAIGVHSSRAIERFCREHLAFMFLAGMQTPDHTTISNFRTAHKEALEEIFSQTIYIGTEVGLITYKHIAIDGTKVDSAGSKSQIAKGEKLESRIEKCQAYAKELLEQAQKADDSEEKEKIEQKIHKIDSKIDKLEAAKEKYDKEKTGNKSIDEKLKYHLTEEEARLMKDKDGFHSSYNCQTAVDSENQMILNYEVTNDQNDQNQGVKQRANLILRCGKETLKGAVISFDNGYSSTDLLILDNEDDIKILVAQQAEGKQITSKTNNNSKIDFKYDPEKDVVICPQGNELPFKRVCPINENDTYRVYVKSGCDNCPLSNSCFRKGTKNKNKKTKMLRTSEMDSQKELEAFREKMNQPEVREEYKKRMSTVEPVFAHMTSHRKASRFSVWGMDKAQIEYSIMCITHNIVKILTLCNLDDLAKAF